MKLKKPAKPFSLQNSATRVAHELYRYRVLLFFVLLAGVYSIILLRINTLSQAQPDASQVTVQVTQKSLKVDPTVVEKIKQLQDNSVSVQALFDQARNNPFHE
ncbi:MAG TPA: hypothetical protein VJR27_05770 [Candidatus Saccharimonadales bacterium]|nr:hypothetical protein [Candidatus Saccharimonadales bacterium]